VGEIEYLVNNFLCIDIEIIHNFPIWPARVVGKKQQLKIARIPELAKPFEFACNKLAA
jgi:hypothetical protein